MSYRVSDVAYLKEYLKYATMFEKNYYIWSQAMNEVNRQASNIVNERNVLQKKSQQMKSVYAPRDTNDIILGHKDEEQRYRRISRIAKAILIAEMCFTAILAVIIYAQQSGVSLTEISIGSLFLLLLIGLLGMLAGVCNLVGIVSLIIWRKFKSKAEFSKKEAERFAKTGQSNLVEIQIERYQSHINEYNIQENHVLAKKREISAALNNAKINLDKLYSENILPSKYRSFNAVATMYEYLATGRCNTIQGHGGIYDTYERDLQMGLIIRNLENIDATLSNIEANQQMLRRELYNANATLRTINSSLLDIKKTNRQIADNTAISAEANRQTAAATQWFTWRAWARGF